MSRARPLGSAVLVFSLAVAFPVAVIAAPPSNDNFASAQTLSGSFPIVVRGTLAEATQEPGEPEDQYGASVWYAWTAPRTSKVTIDTCGGQSYAPITFVYRGPSVSELQPVTSEDEFERRSVCPLPDPDMHDPGDTQRVTQFAAIAGTTYRIQVVYGDSFALVLKDAEVYDLGISQSVSRRRVPFGGTVRELVKVTNRGNIAVPVPQDPRAAFGQELNRPHLPTYAGKAIYASVSSPGSHCNHGLYAPGTKVQVFACDVTHLAPGESQTAVVKIKNIKGPLLLDGHLFLNDDRRGNDDAQVVIRVRR